MVKLIKGGILIQWPCYYKLLHFSMGVEVSGDLVTSILIVNNAGGSDAGSYSCTLPVFGNMDFPRARANVHLIYGKINENKSTWIQFIICKAVLYFSHFCSQICYNVFVVPSPLFFFTISGHNGLLVYIA